MKRFGVLLTELAIGFVVCTVFAPASGAGAWTQVPLPPHVEYLTCLTAGSDHLFASMCDSSGTYLGLFRTPLESPGDWESIGLQGFLIRKVIAAGDRDSHLLVPSLDSPIEVRGSTDGGQTWEARDAGIPNDRWVLTLESNGAFPGRIYAPAKAEGAGEGLWVYRSTNFGLSWSETLIANGVTNGIWYAAAPPDGGPLAYSMEYSGYMESRTRKTTDGGMTWAEIDQGMGYEDYTSDLDVSPRGDPQMLFAPTELIAIRVWRNDAWWDWIYHPFAYMGLVGNETPAWAPQHLFSAGVDVDLRLSAALTTYPYSEWTMLNEGFPGQPGPGPNGYEYVKRFQFEAAPHAPLLFYSAWGRGLWMREMSDLVTGLEGGSGEEVSLSLGTPAPNPTTGRVQIGVSAPGNRPIVTEILDVQGRVMHTVERAGGRGGPLTWDGRDAEGKRVAAGVYYVRARAGDHVSTQPVVVVR